MMLKVCLILTILFYVPAVYSQDSGQLKDHVAGILRDKILAEADEALLQQPVTVTASQSPRSAGTIHDFYSEGDYWWPDSTNLNGPYVQRDGMTNPDNFTDHRKAMIRFSMIIGSLVSAWTLTHNDLYLTHTMKHLDAWFINEKTKMNPSLLYAQAIKGRVTGRGIGIIDTIHLIEVAQSVRVLEHSSAIDKKLLAGVKQWFSEYLLWLTTHPYGKDEMNAKNNHGTCWVMQVAAFAKLTGNQDLLNFCRDRYVNVLLPEQMAADGSFPLELKRTKPYGYSIFNLDAMVMICVILSDEKNNLWDFITSDGKSIRKGINFLFPYLKNKTTWPFAKDVMYWDEWPVAQPSLVFSAIAFNDPDWFSEWKRADHSPKGEEIIRNLPVRNPSIWLNEYLNAH